MTSILDLCAEQQFQVPRNPTEYLALQIARKLGDLAQVRDYAVLLEHFPDRIIVNAFQRARSRLQLNRDGFLAAFREATATVEEDGLDE